MRRLRNKIQKDERGTALVSLALASMLVVSLSLTAFGLSTQISQRGQTRLLNELLQSTELAYLASRTGTIEFLPVDFGEELLPDAEPFVENLERVFFDGGTTSSYDLTLITRGYSLGRVSYSHPPEEEFMLALQELTADLTPQRYHCSIFAGKNIDEFSYEDGDPQTISDDDQEVVSRLEAICDQAVESAGRDNCPLGISSANSRVGCIAARLRTKSSVSFVEPTEIYSCYCKTDFKFENTHSQTYFDAYNHIHSGLYRPPQWSAQDGSVPGSGGYGGSLGGGSAPQTTAGQGSGKR